jgi:hypothetical protein
VGVLTKNKLALMGLRPGLHSTKLVQISSFRTFAACAKTTRGEPVYSGAWNVLPKTASRPGGPSAKREPSPEGLGIGGETRAP